VRFCGNGVYGRPAILRVWSKGGSGKGLCAAGTGDDAGDQVVGEDGYQDDDGVRVSNEALRATIRKSREVLAMHRDLLQQVSYPTIYF
jgi:starch synthase